MRVWSLSKIITNTKETELDETFLDNLLNERVKTPIETEEKKTESIKIKTSRIKHKSIMERLLESKPTWI